LAEICAERILDGAVLSVLGVVGLVVTGMTQKVFILFIAPIVALFGVLSCILVWCLAREDSARRIVAKLNGFFPGHLTRFATKKINYGLNGISRLGGRFRLPAAVVATAAIWMIEVVFYYEVSSSLFQISLPTAVMFVTVVNFASLFPLTIGGLGAIEGAATAFLVSAGVPDHQALAMVIIQHVYQLLFTTVIGGLVYATGRRFRDQQQTDSEGLIERSTDDVLVRTRQTLDGLHATLVLDAPTERPRPLLSIVIPAYNERDRLPRTALETILWCRSNHLTYEVLIVDDGSQDDTLAIGELLERHDPHTKCLACPHKGKGAAVRMGMLNAHGQYVLFMDADGATPLTEIPRLLAEVAKGFDVAIGSRVLQQPGEVTVETSLHRKLIGRVFAFFVNVFAVSGIADTQCGFKLFKSEASKRIFVEQKLEGFAFDVEILFIAKRLGLLVSEVPVNWRNQSGSKVNLVRDSVAMLWDLAWIRWTHRRVVTGSARPASVQAEGAPL